VTKRHRQRWALLALDEETDRGRIKRTAAAAAAGGQGELGMGSEWAGYSVGFPCVRNGLLDIGPGRLVGRQP
jgi:glycine cleavage system pyridoxal-binding protein P